MYKKTINISDIYLIWYLIGTTFRINIEIDYFTQDGGLTHRLAKQFLLGGSTLNSV